MLYTDTRILKGKLDKKRKPYLSFQINLFVVSDNLIISIFYSDPENVKTIRYCGCYITHENIIFLHGK